MKFTISTIFYASAVLATASAAPSTRSTYNLRVGSKNPAIKDALLAAKDESATTSPNPLGIWSSGEPRSAYAFTMSPNPANSKLFEPMGTLRHTHLILSGPDAAMALSDVPIGADPTPAKGESLFTSTFMRWSGDQVRLAERYKPGGDPNDLVGAGTWRACKGNSKIDYQVIWFDGLSRLEDYVKGCETIELYFEEVKPGKKPGSSFITGVPAPSATTGSGPFITGVPAPGSCSSFITGVPVPSSATGNGPFITGVPAPDSDSSFITGVPAPTATSDSGSFITGVPAPAGNTSCKGSYPKTFRI